MKTEKYYCDFCEEELTGDEISSNNKLQIDIRWHDEYFSHCTRIHLCDECLQKIGIGKRRSQ